jgi:hypothetical protein
MEKNEIGGDCGKYGRAESCIKSSGGETRDNLEDLGVKCLIILKLIFKK